MALFTEAMLINTDYDLPEGETGVPAHPNDQLTLQLSDNTLVSVFDKLTTGLRLLTYMRQHSQWQVAASDDVTVVSVNSVKGMILENSLINQKLITSFLPIYIGDQVRFVHRSMSTVLSLTDALKSVGYCLKADTPFANNLDLRLGDTGIQLFDWNFMASPADSTSGSLLNDGTPIRYDFTA